MRLARSSLPRRDIAPLHFAYDPMQQAGADHFVLAKLRRDAFEEGRKNLTSSRPAGKHGRLGQAWRSGIRRNCVVIQQIILNASLLMAITSGHGTRARTAHGGSDAHVNACLNSALMQAVSVNHVSGFRHGVVVDYYSFARERRLDFDKRDPIGHMLINKIVKPWAESSFLRVPSFRHLLSPEGVKPDFQSALCESGWNSVGVRRWYGSRSWSGCSPFRKSCPRCVVCCGCSQPILAVLGPRERSDLSPHTGQSGHRAEIAECRS
jgi:hypothetical protein